MRKTIFKNKIFVLLVIMITGLAISFSACSLFCKHDNPTQIIDLDAVAPTCTKTGLTSGTKCGRCGEMLIPQKVIAAVNHNFSGWVTLKDPTLTEKGLMERVCICGEKETQEIDTIQPSVGLELTLNDDGISYSVTRIGDCIDTDIVVPSTYNNLPVTSIGRFAFKDCRSLTSITIPDSVTNIGEVAFYCCSGLTSITIPDSVTGIGDYAFWNCCNLTSITIPDSITSIGNGPFNGCTNLTSIKVSDKNTVYEVKGNCLIEKSSKTLIAGCKNSVIPIDGSVTTIGERAFSECAGLTSITIPNCVTSIGAGAFSYCPNLTNIAIPDNVTSISISSFRACSNLMSISIPDSVTSIDNYALLNCNSLTSIIFNGTKSQWDAINKSSSWTNDTNNYTVYCTDGTISK